MHLGFCGTREHRKGCGKTTYAVYRVHQFYLDGYKIYSNTPLSFDYSEIHPDTIFDLTEEQLNKSVIFIDEIQNWFNSFSTNFSNVLFSFIINQTRKTNTHIIWTSQRKGNVQKRIRDDAEMRAVLKFHLNWQRCYDDNPPDIEESCTMEHILALHQFANEFDDFDDTVMDYPESYIVLSPYIFDLFDTKKVIEMHIFDSEALRKKIISKQEQKHRPISIDDVSLAKKVLADFEKKKYSKVKI